MRFHGLQRLLAFALAPAALLTTTALAADPGVPDFFWPYGRVLVNGANLSPTAQPVVALVNGKVCGFAETKVATAEPGTPAEDVGKTVYVIDVLADGPGAGQRPGCGHPGDPVTLYFPGSHLIADVQPTFQQGPLRLDLNLTRSLTARLFGGMVSADGPQ
jgi:hypothetical protein